MKYLHLQQGLCSTFPNKELTFTCFVANLMTPDVHCDMYWLLLAEECILIFHFPPQKREIVLLVFLWICR